VIEHQLSWNLYLTTPVLGGEVQIWDRRWVPSDETEYRYDRATKKGYDPTVVEGFPSAMVEPRVGRFVLFNALYYHTVRDVVGGDCRLAMSSFVGSFNDDRPLLLWS